MGIFDGAKSITMNNKVVSSITTDTGVLYQKKVNSQLSIDVPLNLTYSDDFNITGYLTSNGVGVVGATVNLLVGSTVVDFTTTTTGGAYSFTNTPVSAGNHSFQVVFNGNSEYFASESSIVNRVVNKETSVLLNVTQTGKIGFASTGTGYNSVTPACILRTDDDEAIAYATIHFGDAIDSTQIDGYAQGNDVTYPTTSVNIVYEGDSNYTPSSVLASFEYQIPTLLNLSGTNIISKDETTTISGVLYDQDGDIIPNCQLEYNIKHNSTIITSGTVRTDNNGAITLNYTGTGAGDVDITVSYGNLLQETYEVIDAKYYNDGSTTTGLTAQNGVSVTSDGEYVSITTSTSGEKYILTPISVESSDNWEYSCKVSTIGSGQFLAWNLLNENQFSIFNNIYFAIDSSGSGLYSRLHGGSGRTYPMSIADNDTITLKRLNGHWILYHNDTQVFDAEYTWTGAKTIGYYTNNGRKQVLKDIVIKAL